MDSVGDRLFVMLSDLSLIELNLATKEVVQLSSIRQVEGLAETLEHDSAAKALAFGVFRELNMMAVSTGSAVHMIDYEAETLTYVTSLEVPNVSYLTFVDVYVVLMSESDDGSECTIVCHQIDGAEPEGAITIKQWRGEQCRVKPADSSVVFATGSQIGRVMVPEMELSY